MWEEGEWQENEITQTLDVLGAGLLLGAKFPVMKVLCVDFYVGGMIRLSTYRGEDGLTRYQKWTNIDYSGVAPTVGLDIGILK